MRGSIHPVILVQTSMGSYMLAKMELEAESWIKEVTSTIKYKIV